MSLMTTVGMGVTKMTSGGCVSLNDYCKGWVSLNDYHRAG